MVNDTDRRCTAQSSEAPRPSISEKSIPLALAGDLKNVFGHCNVAARVAGTSLQGYCAAAAAHICCLTRTKCDGGATMTTAVVAAHMMIMTAARCNRGTGHLEGFARYGTSTVPYLYDERPDQQGSP